MSEQKQVKRYRLKKDYQKQCATICVDEMLELIYSDESAIIVSSSYWEEVKQEITKL